MDVSKIKHKAGHAPHPRVSLFVAFCLMVNYIIGVGILETPYAFAQGGILLSIIATFVITGLMIIVVMYVLDGMARARYVCSFIKHPPLHSLFILFRAL